MLNVFFSYLVGWVYFLFGGDFIDMFNIMGQLDADKRGGIFGIISFWDGVVILIDFFDWIFTNINVN